VAYIGALYSLAQTLLRTTLPGVPDLYQGSERWNLALVDPDNRRPPDFAANARALERLRASRPESNRGALSRLAAAWPDGRLKLFVTYRALETRRRHRALFERGEYLPVLETGRPARPVLAYARRLGRAWALVAVGRRLAASGASEAAPPVGEFWSDRRLRLPKHAPRDWRSVLSPRTVRAQGGNAPELVLREVFRDLPVAMLVARSDAGRRRAPERDRHPARRRASARARA
jgi:(1->4)-alpha-D-glucan 1-alpha-D-glucosylmutase